VTFYNVLSALLFVGTLRVLLMAIDTSSLGVTVSAACLAIVVFNDMLSTSYTVESTQKTPYTLPLMTIDLVNFVLLALGVVVLSPADNLFDVPLPHLALWLGAPSLWLLLTFYWLLLMLWTRISCGEPQTPSVVLWQVSVVVVFFVEWLLSRCAPAIATQAAIVVLIYLVSYLTLIRFLVRRRAAQA